LNHGFYKRVRMPLGFLLAAVYVVFARPSENWFIPGLIVAFAGLLIRAWAAGHIEKNSRLSVAGPYAYVRNPLYLGSSLIAIGFAMSCHWLFVVLVVAFFVLIYAPTIEQEKAKMLSLFPEQYPAYAANVPPFIPRTSPWRPEPVVPVVPVVPVAPGSSSPPGGTGFSLERYLKHSEWKAALGFFAACAWLVLRMRLGF
jgi:protein-S-isoprenylcysteine O-methyltransferase Ste14